MKLMKKIALLAVIVAGYGSLKADVSVTLVNNLAEPVEIKLYEKIPAGFGFERQASFQSIELNPNTKGSLFMSTSLGWSPDEVGHDIEVWDLKGDMLAMQSFQPLPANSEIRIKEKTGFFGKKTVLLELHE